MKSLSHFQAVLKYGAMPVYLGPSGTEDFFSELSYTAWWKAVIAQKGTIFWKTLGLLLKFFFQLRIVVSFLWKLIIDPMLLWMCKNLFLLRSGSIVFGAMGHWGIMLEMVQLILTITDFNWWFEFFE